MEDNMTAKERVLEDLLNLLDIYAPSYSEKPVADYLEKSIGEHLDRSYVDDLYNFIGAKANECKPSVIIDAHIDEIPRKEGGPDAGASVRENIVEGKGIDNRAGDSAMLEIARRLKDYRNANIHYLGTAREEVDETDRWYEGAKKAVEAMPGADLAIVIDVTPAFGGDHGPGLGKGVVLAQRDMPKRLDNMAREATQLSYKIADKYKVSYQTASYEWKNDIDDTNAYVYRRKGIPTILLSIPVEHMHGKRNKYSAKGIVKERVHLDDILSTVDIAVKIVKELYGD